MCLRFARFLGGLRELAARARDLPENAAAGAIITGGLVDGCLAAARRDFRAADRFVDATNEAADFAARHCWCLAQDVAALTRRERPPERLAPADESSVMRDCKLSGRARARAPEPRQPAAGAHQSGERARARSRAEGGLID